jgi:hypothetical protein
VFVPRHHPHATVIEVLERAARGEPHAQIARTTGVPIDTARLWIYGRIPREVAIAINPETFCQACGEAKHDPAALPPREYPYLLGLYLGDGNIFRHSRRSCSLRITLDDATRGSRRRRGRRSSPFGAPSLARETRASAAAHSS